MKILFPFAAVVVVLGFALAGNEAPSGKPKALRVLMVTGGCCHDYENQKMILELKRMIQL
jgi:hypothetical protein